MAAGGLIRDAVVGRLRDRILEARARRTSLDIRGGGTKRFYGEAPRGEPLEVAELTGISSYEPSELVITARAGTPLAEVEAVLGERGQCLAFEPPRFAPGGTVGGMIASGLSGPARAATGPLRDYVLGVTMLNGRGELLTFGGQVMKNVAGYDVSRLMAGSWGILGILCEVSLKVCACKVDTAALSFEWDEPRALAEMARWNASALSMNASAWHEGRLHVRLSGAAAAVRSACRKLGGAPLEPSAAAEWWDSVRDHRHPFFRPSAERLAAGERLWRVSVPPTTESLRSLARGNPGFEDAGFIAWGGAERWMCTRAPADEVRTLAASAGGHATLVRAADKTDGAFTRVSEPLMRIHRALKRAFDPDRVLNAGRLYAEL
jgi:FAD/FMN-containing dehydrogenase